MFLVFGFGVAAPGGTFRSGEYNLDNCGGPCDWFLTAERPTNPEAYIGTVEWGGENYFCLLDFYDAADVETSILYREFAARTPLIQVNDTMYVALSTEKLAVFDCIADGQDDPDVLGGLVLWGDLRQQTSSS